MRIAVVGAGISGLAAAYVLSQAHDVEVFERDRRLGGHAHTHTLRYAGQEWCLDSGFIVFNRRTYPNFIRLLGQLGVTSRRSDMAHSVQCLRCHLEYSSYGLRGYFAQRRRLLDGLHLGLLADLPRFFRNAHGLLSRGSGEDCSLGTFLEDGRYSGGFIRHYLLPMGATVWSAQRRDMRAFSARHFLGFLHNHGKLALAGAPPWYTIEGGSRAYVDALARGLEGRVHLASPVRSVCRDASGVDVHLSDGVRRFDKVVLATHANVSLSLMDDTNSAERAALSPFRYAPNRAVLHTDASVLPKAASARAAWNTVVEDCQDETGQVQVSYDLNRLHALSAGAPQFCLSLNHPGVLRGDVLASMDYDHPIQDAPAIAAQPRVQALNGAHNTYYCGAYLGNGFHEDGLVSALRVADHFGLGL
ncbi:MAG: FAD-dependent oxidoreductase [Chloroflexota bacterium]|nr:FAD-dependent oxidoreductase [Chloroflexota bacterium]